MTDGCLVALGSSLERLLPAPAGLAHQPADMVAMIADAEGAPEDLGDAGGGPHVAAKAVRLRPAGEQVGDLGALLGGQFGRPTGPGPRAQRLRAALPPALEPLADGGPADAQRGGDVLLPPALLVQFPGALASPFPGVRSWVLGLWGL